MKPTLQAEVDSESCHKGAYDQYNDFSTPQPLGVNSSVDFPVGGTASIDAKREKIASQKRATRKSSKEAADIKDREVSISADAYLSSNPDSSNKAGTRHKVFKFCHWISCVFFFYLVEAICQTCELHWVQLRGRDPTNSEDGFSEIHIINGSMSCDKYNEQRRALQQSSGVKSQTRAMDVKEIASGYNMPIREVASCKEDISKREKISQMASTCESLVSKSAADRECVKLSESAKCIRKATRGQPHLEKVRKGHGFGVSGIYSLVCTLLMLN